MAAPDPRRMLLLSVAEADSALRRALIAAAKDAQRVIESEPRRIGEEVSQAQILRIMAELRALAHQLWGESIPDELARVIAAAERRSQQGSDVLDELMVARLASPSLRKDLAASIRQRARRVVQVFETRQRMIRFELSERVYKWEAWHNGRVEAELSKQFALGRSAREIAKAVRDFIHPDTPGGVSYAAMRLGRTEVANAFHEQTQRDYADNPFVTGLKWNLSRSHPSKDPCDALAAGHSRGLPKGIYRVEDVPRKPHPQCLCHLSPETVNEKKFQDEFLDGGYNEFLMNKYPDIDPEDLPPY